MSTTARKSSLMTLPPILESANSTSSEKARIPAWTDRILRKGAFLRQIAYDSAPLKFSDHRPVYAAFECRVNIVDELRRDAISRQLYNSRKAEVGESGTHVADLDDSDEEDLIGYDAIEPGLPPASSDRQKWWLDNKQPARARAAAPPEREGHVMTLNPNRPSNPFGQAEDHDWISIPRSSSKTSLSSISSSPYEKVSLPSRMQSSASTRKLPPVYDGGSVSQRMGQMQLTGGDHPPSRSQGGTTAALPPPPPPRRQTGPMGTTASPSSAPGGMKSQQPRPPSAASTTSSQQRAKAAPPVAKKPAHLSDTSPMMSPITMVSRDDSGSKPPLPRRTPTGTANGTQPPGAIRMPGMIGREMQTPLPRRPVGAPTGQQPPGDLLDDDGPGIGGWETLQPVRR